MSLPRSLSLKPGTDQEARPGDFTTSSIAPFVSVSRKPTLRESFAGLTTVPVHGSRTLFPCFIHVHGISRFRSQALARGRQIPQQHGRGGAQARRPGADLPQVGGKRDFHGANSDDNDEYRVENVLGVSREAAGLTCGRTHPPPAYDSIDMFGDAYCPTAYTKAQVALTTREVTINQDMKALLPCEPRTQEFLLTAFRSFERQALTAIERSSHGTCKLKTEVLHDFVMPIPPLAEQRRIVAKVEQLMALVDALERQLAALVTEPTGT